MAQSSASQSAQANQAYFEKVAHKAGSMNALKERIMKDTTEAILDAYDFDEETTVLMDFACGLASQQLAQYCKEVIGVDANENMVEQYNLKVAEQGIPAMEMRAICSTLDKGDELQGKKFDVILCALGYHHFEDIKSVTTKLATHLSSDSGMLIIVDHVKSTESSDKAHPSEEDTTEHEHHGGGGGVVVHPGGFTESELRDAVVAAGLAEPTFKSYTTFKKAGNVKEMFIATGIKADRAV